MYHCKLAYIACVMRYINIQDVKIRIVHIIDLLNGDSVKQMGLPNIAV